MKAAFSLLVLAVISLFYGGITEDLTFVVIGGIEILLGTGMALDELGDRIKKLESKVKK